MRLEGSRQTAALVPFGLFLVVLGYLWWCARLPPRWRWAFYAPSPGLPWPLAAIPGVPSWCQALAVVLGIVAEGSLAVRLLAAPS
jgi:hypothetical protein